MANVRSEKALPNGKRRLVVDLDPDESFVTVRDGTYLKLAYPMEDVVPADAVTDADVVTWCPVEQRWVP